MKYWARITMRDLDIIQVKTRAYLQTNASEFIAPFSPIRLDDFILHVPEITTAFADHALTVTGIAAYIMWNNSAGGAHRDYMTDAARINIPIAHCAGTWTRFYALREGVPEPDVVVNSMGQPYRPYTWDHLQQMDQVEINQPTVIRPLEIHSIEMDTQRAPRITLTISTDPVPLAWVL